MLKKLKSNVRVSIISIFRDTTISRFVKYFLTFWSEVLPSSSNFQGPVIQHHIPKDTAMETSKAEDLLVQFALIV
jgi:hypothetical protein